jgi:hypothetical protein
MPEEIKIDGNYAVEESTYVITLNFTDENGDPVTPTAANWTLTDESGAAINSRENVVLSGLAAEMEVVLSGNDLAISSGFSGVSEMRVFTIEATYNSDLGVGLPLKDQLKFPVYNLAAVT